eukprot:1532103-Pyramimonas_sp.AAC.1
MAGRGRPRGLELPALAASGVSSRGSSQTARDCPPSVGRAALACPAGPPPAPRLELSARAPPW